MHDEKFEFTRNIKKQLFITLVVGIALVILGVIMIQAGGHGHEAGEGAEEGGHAFHWSKRLFANLWINNVYFGGIALVGVFFVALQYAAQAGWSAYLKRVPEAFGYWLPVAGVLMVAYFLLFGHDLFHWTHPGLYQEFLEDGVTQNPEYDEIIAGKKPFLNTPFFLTRMIVFFLVWFGLFLAIRKHSLAEDLEGGETHWRKMRVLSTIFIIVFAITTSIAAWDWILSIDTHWFSTMIGWYTFASWFVAGLAFITLIVVVLTQNGYLVMVNENHFHDLGKFVFAFSIFWTYLWLSQYLLIYYANIAEETIYYSERLQSEFYWSIFHINLLICFIFPFLMFMTRDSKRHVVFIKIVCIGVLFGHWLDFYLMVTPGTLQENGGFGFMEIGLLMVYVALFLFVVLYNLSKAPLVAKNHPMLEESIHHHI